VLLGVWLGCCSSAPAWANGRFPRADQLVAIPGEPAELVLRTTFGLLFSHDAGQSWDWVCESAIGFSGQDDPALAAMQGGVVLAGLFDGLASSPDRGCSWHFADTAASAMPIIDLSVRPDRPSSALALAWEAQPVTLTTPGYRSRFFSTIDAGGNWQSYGTGIDASVLVLTLDVAPTDPHRLYASGVRSGMRRAASLFVSTDDGESWVERPVPFDDNREQGLYIAAIDPTSPELVYLRTSGATASRLLVTRDAGATFEERYFGPPMLGFALSADGASVFLGSIEQGLWAASRSSLEFEQRSTLPILCLLNVGDSLYACSNDQGGFAVGASRDGGVTFGARLKLSQVRGPLECPAGASVARCAAEWASVGDRLGIPPEQLGLAPEPPGMSGLGSGDGGLAPPANSGSKGCSLAAGAVAHGSVVALATLFGAIGLGGARRRQRLNHLSAPTSTGGRANRVPPRRDRGSLILRRYQATGRHGGVS
jgi:photosystem II stability/assembly factor-like uncharacterized protein